MFMPDLVGPVRVALGAVVLDTPDRTGCYVAKDSVGGWSYLVIDSDGDHRFRGDGTCAGGVDVALRWAVLAALNHVPDCRRIQLFVSSPQTHGAMLRLAQVDDLVIEAMGGRMLTMLVRPNEKSVRRAIGAAEMAAIALLRERARTETVQLAREAALQDEAPAAIETFDEPGGSFAEWRERRGQATPAAAPVVTPAGRAAPVGNLLVNMVAPLIRRHRKPQRNPSIASWMQDLELRINTVKSGLEGVGVS